MISKDDLKSAASYILHTDDNTLYIAEQKAALFLVRKLFADVKDKAGAPYLGHLYRVTSGVSDDRVKAAALMHDLIEDIDGWTFEDLRDIGFSENTIQRVRAVTKQDGEKYFDAMVRVGETYDAIAIKRSDLKDNSNLFRLNHLPLQKDFNRVSKYFLADKYLEAVQNRQIPQGTPFADWMRAQPKELQDFELLKKETSKPFSPS